MNPSNRPIRIGLLGAARIAPGALMEPARTNPDVRVVTVAARDPARARAFQQAHGLEDASASYAELIGRDDIDLVYVALPPDAHCRWSTAALEHGKHVLCEKPFALDAGEASIMVECAERSGRFLIEAFHYRFHGMMRAAVAAMEAGAIGRPLRARAHVAYPIPERPGEPRWSAGLGGGSLMDLGCYGLHALRSLLGAEPEVMAAKGRWRHGVDAAMEVELAFGEVEAMLTCAMDPDAPTTTIVIEGSEGRLDIAGFVLPQRAGRAVLASRGRERKLPVEGPSSYAAQLAHVVGVIRGDERPMTGGPDAVANMRAIDAIRRAAGVPA